MIINNRISSYSITALAIISKSEIKAQAIYTDIDPDTMIQCFPSEEIAIDMDVD